MDFPTGSCDIAIVGGGPAGAFAAWLLARQGARVRLFDPSHPREKPCGGGVTGRALALVAPMLAEGASVAALGGPTRDAGSADPVRAEPIEIAPAGAERAGADSEGRRVVSAGSVSLSQARTDAPAGRLASIAGVPVRSARFEGANDRSAAVDLYARGFTPDSSLIVMSRRAFDRALLDGAIAAGAVHDPARVAQVEATAAGARVTTASGTWQARYVIGADGANSFVRRRLGRAFARRQLSIATGFFAHGVTSPEIVIRFVPDPQGYIWSFPRADHLAIGICAQADESQPGPLRALVARWIERARIAPGASLEPYSWPIPSLAAEDFDRDRPAGPGWMLVGDAAGLVDPITREGIFFALRSAQLAVEALNAADGDPWRRYHAALREEIHPELKRAARVKRNFFRGPFTRLLIDALERSAPVRDIMRDLVAGEQPYRTLRGRLLRTFEVGLAWQLARLQFGQTWKSP